MIEQLFTFSLKVLKVMLFEVIVVLMWVNLWFVVGMVRQTISILRGK